ncbi:MAG TPA: MaoC family dehydratase N-terminal domain-containing protein [Candidatus Avipropionibacterium avicola]|uniref:MaoC family dehydratase N-terminal domain-containing protein n=1 Tax=Candidatus Avipropionibacterium avicola TaxID=2840701 RepID=A0A9D1GWZ1_9ACTN|nr:MaoC family dehydratase N-terminal domain-containing protein [Candidatus Avipropionibacterium avicola]
MSDQPSVGSTALDDLEKGDVVATVTETFTRERLVRYAAASGDFNPIHWSDRIATGVGLPGVIAHGMLTMGVAIRVVVDWLGDTERLVSYQTRFARPVVVPDTDDGVEVTVTGTVSALDEQTVTVMIDCRCGDDKVLGAARAVIRRG